MDVFVQSTLFKIFHILFLAVYFVQVYDLYLETNIIIVAKFYFVCIVYVYCAKLCKP
jgi:hypothetical protein